MTSEYFRAPIVFDTSRPANGLTSLIMGIDSRAESFEAPARALNQIGRRVAIYDYPTDVLNDGDPAQLVGLAKTISRDIERRSEAFDDTFSGGASLGGLFAYYHQRRQATKSKLTGRPLALPGLYATAPVNLVDTLASSHLPQFKSIWKTYSQNYDRDHLDYLLRDLDVYPDKPPLGISGAVVVLGKLDPVVSHRKAMATIEAWQNAGVPIEPVVRQRALHSGAIDFYKRNIVPLHFASLGLLQKASESDRR